MGVLAFIAVYILIGAVVVSVMSRIVWPLTHTEFNPLDGLIVMVWPLVLIFMGPSALVWALSRIIK